MSFVRVAGLVTAFVLIVGLSGCDLLGSPKKAKKPASKATAEVSATEPASGPGPLPEDVVARIGKWTLTTDQFNQRLKLLKEGLPEFDPNKPGNKEAVLNELIRQQLLVKEAEDTGVNQQKDIVEAVEDFRRTLLVQELANRLTKDVVATEKDAKDYYDQNPELFVEPLTWKVREIVVADEVAAKNILVQVLQGGDFSEIAKAQSKGKTAAKGGELAPFVKAPFEAMQTALASLDRGSVSSVLKGPQGFYIVKVEEKKGGQSKPFAEVKADLISGLTLRKQQQVILDHINQLAVKDKVEINKSLLGSAKQP